MDRVMGGANFLNFRKNDFLGIDIANETLIIAHMVIQFNKKELVNIFSSDIKGLSEESVAERIKTFIEKSRIKNPAILGIIPSHFAITKNIEVPSTDPREIKEIINLHANRQTPYGRDEIVVDYINIGLYRENYTKILQVIVTKNFVNRYTGILEKVGFQPQRMFLIPDAIARFYSIFLSLKTKSAPKIILHIDAATTDFIVVFRQNVIFLRSMPVGGRQLLEGKEQNQDFFIDEFRNTIEAYKSEGIEETAIDEVIFTEERPWLDNLIILMQGFFSAKIKTLPYLKEIPAAGEIKTQIKASPASFLKVIAPLLVFEKLVVDFTPQEAKLSREIKEKGRDVIKVGISLMIALVLICSISLIKIYFKTTYLKSLDEKYHSLNQEAKELDRSLDRIRMVRKYLDRRGYSLEFLKELYGVTPADIRYNEIRFQGSGDFSLSGTARSMSRIFSFISALDKTKFFKNAKAKYTKTKEEEGGTVADFKINNASREKVFFKKEK